MARPITPAEHAKHPMQPCAFCGATLVGMEGHRTSAVMSGVCFACGPLTATTTEAMIFWNTRVPASGEEP
jgi:hypothetical protein